MEENRKCVVCGCEKPENEFWKNKWGYTNTCKACAVKKQNKIRKPLVEQRRLAKLENYTPRELLAELKRRGYKWEKMYYVIKQEVDFNNI